MRYKGVAKKPINIDTTNLNIKYIKIARSENHRNTLGQNLLTNFQPA